MATQVIRNDAVFAVPQERSDAWKRIKEMFGSFRDLMTVYVGGHSAIGSLDPAYRATLNGPDRVEVDSYLLGIRVH